MEQEALKFHAIQQCELVGEDKRTLIRHNIISHKQRYSNSHLYYQKARQMVLLEKHLLMENRSHPHLV